MIAAFDNGSSNIYYHYYGRKDGMDITELNGGCQPCALQLNDTVLSFPSMDGLVWVDPTRPLLRLPEGKIYIDGFTADSQHIDINSLTSFPSLPPTARELFFSLEVSPPGPIGRTFKSSTGWNPESQKLATPGHRTRTPPAI